MVRYIVNVRQYISDGDGKVNVASIAGYPMEVPGTAMQHMITSLGTARLHISLLNPLTSSSLPQSLWCHTMYSWWLAMWLVVESQ